MQCICGGEKKECLQPANIAFLDKNTQFLKLVYQITNGRKIKEFSHNMEEN
jgi:hypothetical protein